MPDDLDAVMRRIKAAMALAERAGTPEEAAAAAARVQAILLRYNLDLAEVEAHTGQPAEGIWQAGVELERDWEAKLLAVVARAHACHTMRHADAEGSPASHYSVVGYEHNTRVVMLVFPWLRDLLGTLAGGAMETALNRMDVIAWGEPGTWLESYMVGAIEGVYWAYAERNRTEDPGPTNALMLDQRDAALRTIEEEIKKAYPNATDQEVNPPEAYGPAYRAGKVDAEGINLDPQLSPEGHHEALAGGSPGPSSAL